MSVSLWFQPNDLYPGGFRSTFATADEATAQAVADLHANRTPGPDRIVDDETGSVLTDRAALDKLAQKG